jgi:hypothetical protein
LHSPALRTFFTDDDLLAVHEATPSGVRFDSRNLLVNVKRDVVNKRIVEFVSKLALK